MSASGLSSVYRKATEEELYEATGKLVAFVAQLIGGMYAIHYLVEFFFDADLSLWVCLPASPFLGWRAIGIAIIVHALVVAGVL